MSYQSQSPKPRRLNLAQYDKPCPDPKEFGCKGKVSYVSAVVGPGAKHPDWLMCERCHALFTEDGKWAHWGSWGKDLVEPHWVQSREVAASQADSQPTRRDAGYIPW